MRNRVRIGDLRKGFTFNTPILRLHVPAGATVIKSKNRIYFMTDENKQFSNQPIQAFRVGRRYFASLYGSVYSLLPFEPSVPFPLSWLG